MQSCSFREELTFLGCSVWHLNRHSGKNLIWRLRANWSTPWANLHRWSRSAAQVAALLVKDCGRWQKGIFAARNSLLTLRAFLSQSEAVIFLPAPPLKQNLLLLTCLYLHYILQCYFSHLECKLVCVSVFIALAANLNWERIGRFNIWTVLASILLFAWMLQPCTDKT